jgi:hypothetical protein
VPERRRLAGRVLGALLAAVLIGGCGYSTKGSLPEHIKTVGDSVVQGEVVGYSLEFRDVRRNALLWRQEGLQEYSDFQVQGQVSDTIARGQGAVQQAATEIGRKVVNLAVDRF